MTDLATGSYRHGRSGDNTLGDEATKKVWAALFRFLWGKPATTIVNFSGINVAKKLVSQASVQENQCLIVAMGASLCWHLQFYLWSILSPDNQKFKKKKMKPQETSFYFEDTTKPTVTYTPYCSYLFTFF